nr:hypothetical protein [Pseudomonas sp. UBA6718]
MLCEYLRHIDLLAVYEQLDDFKEGRLLSLANIPLSLSDALADLLEVRAEATIEHIYGHASWREFAPCDVAAEVADYIERDIEALGEQLPPDATPANRRLPPQKWIRHFGMFTACAVTIDKPDYWQMHSLLICQYDCACWLYKRKNYDRAMSVLGDYFGAVGVASALTYCDMKSRRTDQHRTAAAARHQETNQQRDAAVVEWEAHGAKVSSMAAFARSRHKDFGVTERTLYGWIRDHRKAKS